MLASATIRLSNTAVRRCTRFGLNPVTKTSIRNFGCSAVLSDDDLPYHIVVGMPALSPTMESGTLSEWYVEEGGSFSAGESLAKIETDKASIDFEAQDDGYVAKILMDAGGDEIDCGVPILVTVEEEEDVAAFKDFVLDESSAPEPAVAAEPEPAVASPPPPPPVVEAAAAPPPPPPAVEPVVAEAPPAEESIAAASTIPSPMSTGWGEFVTVSSPILKTLEKKQNAYLELYGTTGQTVLQKEE